jgi:hypothetical protein
LPAALGVVMVDSADPLPHPAPAVFLPIPEPAPSGQSTFRQTTFRQAHHGMTDSITAARGIVIAAAGEAGPVIAERIYSFHSASETVFLLRIAASAPDANSGGVIIQADRLPSFPAESFPGSTHVEAAVRHVNESVSNRVVCIIEGTEHLPSYRFQKLAEALRRIFNKSFASQVRITVLYNERGPFQSSPFTDAQCFIKSWFGHRAMVVDLEGVPVIERSERDAEALQRLYDPRGLDPSDPLVPSMIRAQNGRAATRDTLSGGVILAATQAGLDEALLTAAEKLFEWDRTDGLAAELLFITSDGDERRRTLLLPVACARRGGPGYFATILRTVPDRLAVKVGKKGNTISLPRGTQLDWDGRTSGDLIMDESTLDDEGFHVRQPDTIADGPGVELIAKVRPGGREVIVPLYAVLGDTVGAAVRVSGFSPSIGDAATVSGSLATAASALRDSEDRFPHLAAEQYTQEQYRVALAALTRHPGPIYTVPSSKRLAVPHLPPFGSGVPARGHEEVRQSLASFVKRRKTMRAD